MGSNQVTSEILDRQPPFNLDAEMGVLGCMMLSPDAIDDIVLMLRPDDFYDDAHRKLFGHMLAMHNEGRKIDSTLLVEKLKTAGDLERIGGVPYLARISNAVPNAAHAIYYATIVREKATYRALIDASTEILREAYEENHEAKQLLGQAEQKIFGILDSRGTSNIVTVQDALPPAMDRIEAEIRGEDTEIGVETGFADLDEILSGLHAEDLVILAARPSMGKTAFAMNIAANILRNLLLPVLFISLEMSIKEMMGRLIYSESRVDKKRVANGTVSPDERQRLVQAAAAINKFPLSFDDSPSRTVSEIAAAARRIKRREGRLGLIVIDYLQLIEPDNQKDPRQEQVAKIARRLKGVARELEVPILCLAQLNRQAEDSKDHVPRLSHLRESGAIEQDADVVMFVHREEYYLRGEAAAEVAGQAEIIIAKQRNGPVGNVDLVWRKEFTRFENKSPNYLEASCNNYTPEFESFNNDEFQD